MIGAKRRKPKSEPFNEEQYNDLPLTDLVIYALFSLRNKSIEGTFENLVVECFELFPDKFYLPGYPEYPDARRVGREVQRLYGSLSEEKGINTYFKGNIKTSFHFTDKGLNKLKEIQKKLKSGPKDKKIIDRLSRDRRGKIEGVLSQVQRHILYQNYLQKGKKTEVPEHILRDLLFATMETSKESLKEKMTILIDYCNDVGRKDIKEFLRFCSMNYPEIFHPNHISKKDDNYR